jgi:uncharacterized protein
MEPLSVYLDASVLVALFINDVFTGEADRFLRNRPIDIVIADFAAAEFASSVSRKVRVGEMKERDARTAFSNFDSWAPGAAAAVETSPADITTATTFLRRLDLTLRAPDAINIAIALRLGAELATFDRAMRNNARALGAPVSDIG